MLHNVLADTRTTNRNIKVTDDSVLTVKTEEEENIVCLAKSIILQQISDSTVLDNIDASAALYTLICIYR